MEGSLAGEIIYEIINYSKKGIIHNYKGLNIHFQRVFRERPENLALISKELTDRAVRELISSGLLYKTKKESFCITQKGNEYAKNSTKSDIIEEYSNFSLTDTVKPASEFFETSTDNITEAGYIPSRDEEYLHLPKSSNSEEMPDIENSSDGSAGSDISGNDRTGSILSDRLHSVAEISEEGISGEAEENIRTGTENYITDGQKAVPAPEEADRSAGIRGEVVMPEAAAAIADGVKSPDKNHFSGSEAYRDIINRFSPAKDAGPAPETKREAETEKETETEAEAEAETERETETETKTETERDTETETKRETETETERKRETEAEKEKEKFLFGNFSPKRDTINGFKPGTGDEAAALEVNHVGEDLTAEASAGDDQEGDDLKIVLSGGSLDTDELLLKLNSEDEEILKRSLAMLGEKGDASAAPEIEKFLNNKSYEIFEAAFEALTKIRNENRQ